MTAEELAEYRRKLGDNYPSLRDQFAMAALSGLVTILNDPKKAAAEAYAVADSMLHVREKA